MLRDLDSRHSAGTIPGATQASRSGVTQGTAIVNALDRPTGKGVTSRMGVVMTVVVLVGAVAATAWWYLKPQTKPASVIVVAPVLAPAATPQTPAQKVKPDLVAGPVVVAVAPV